MNGCRRPFVGKCKFVWSLALPAGSTREHPLPGVLVGGKERGVMWYDKSEAELMEEEIKNNMVRGIFGFTDGLVG
ncbi:hypothetical protein SUGI_0933230 [Cryptomeria japonica]|nr:hypothetical protein SUGI_0933230 [Cryptomeria japonica]